MIYIEEKSPISITLLISQSPDGLLQVSNSYYDSSLTFNIFCLLLCDFANKLFLECIL